MDTVTYPDGRVIAFIHEHFIATRISGSDQNADQYKVPCTPSLVVADEHRAAHFVIEGFLPAEPLLGYLSLGLGKYLLNRQQFVAAVRRFEGVAERHYGTEAGAQSLYWLGVARSRTSGHPQAAESDWTRLIAEYPRSDWARRAMIPEVG